MNGFEIIENALKVIGQAKANTLFSTRDYVMFFEGDPPTGQQEEDLRELGVYYVSKFECYGIDNDLLLDLAKMK